MALHFLFDGGHEPGPVAHSVKPMPARVRHHPFPVIRQLDAQFSLGQKNGFVDSSPLRAGAEKNRHMPCSLRNIAVLLITEDALRKGQTLAVPFNGDKRVTRLKNPRVHERAYW